MNDIQMNVVNYKCLIDTGSVISTISDSFVMTYLKKVQIKEYRSKVQLSEVRWILQAMWRL